MSDQPGLTAQLLHVGPHRGAHRVAARASISVLVPLLVLWSTGHLDLAIYATFGAFTSLHGCPTLENAGSAPPVVHL